MSKTLKAIDIHVTTRHDLEERLSAAVTALQETAMRTRTHGILITRHQPGNYTAALSDQVPYGLTRELFR